MTHFGLFSKAARNIAWPRGMHMLRGEPVAQPVEHLTFNQGVSGSNPDGLTNTSKTYRPSVFDFFPPKVTRPEGLFICVSLRLFALGHGEHGRFGFAKRRVFAQHFVLRHIARLCLHGHAFLARHLEHDVDRAPGLRTIGKITTAIGKTTITIGARIITTRTGTRTGPITIIIGTRTGTTTPMSATGIAGPITASSSAASCSARSWRRPASASCPTRPSPISAGTGPTRICIAAIGTIATKRARVLRLSRAGRWP